MTSIINVNNTNLQRVEFNNELFKSYIDFADVKETTLNSYIVCIKRFMKWLERNGIKNPQRNDIKDYKKFLEDSKLSAGTKARYLRSVKHFFKWTEAENLYPNIAENIKSAKVRADNTKREAFTEADIKKILDSIDRRSEVGKREYAMILLAVTCGLRIIEMQRADVSDIQIIKGQTVLYIQGKGHDDKDDYKKLIPEVTEALQEYIDSREEQSKKAPLFTGTGNRAQGKRLTEPSISRILKTAFKRAGYDCNKLTAHSLRHTSNTLLFKSGADLYTVQQHARHLDPKTTEIYIHAIDKEKSHTEQDIYNQIFKSDTKSKSEQISEAVEMLSEDDKDKVLKYIVEITKGKTTTA